MNVVSHQREQTGRLKQHVTGWFQLLYFVATFSTLCIVFHQCRAAGGQQGGIGVLFWFCLGVVWGCLGVVWGCLGVVWGCLGVVWGCLGVVSMLFCAV